MGLCFKQKEEASAVGTYCSVRWLRLSLIILNSFRYVNNLFGSIDKDNFLEVIMFLKLVG